jgi:predicted amidophosphoribosyltransferase
MCSDTVPTDDDLETTMPYCAKCRSEYVEGTKVCEDCGETLTETLPTPAVRPGDGDLVEIWHTQGEMDAQLMRSLLESNGIQSIFSGESLRLTHGFTVDGLAEVRILVREEDAKRACEVIASLEGMSQCRHCGYPVYEGDATCGACGKTPASEGSHE